MSRARYQTDAQHQGDDSRGGSGIAPGKRAMTSSLPPPRDTVDFFRSGDYRESRATIDGATPTSSRLTDTQLRKARERNPYWQHELGFSPALFGGGDVATGEFADNVADKQAALGLAIDGIAGPRTLHAAINGTASSAASAGASEDPFGMHLLDNPRRRGGERARSAAAPARSAAAPATAPTTAARLSGVTRPTPAQPASIDGSDEAEPAWWTFED